MSNCVKAHPLCEVIARKIPGGKLEDRPLLLICGALDLEAV
jgi:hypothetical protein